MAIAALVVAAISLLVSLLLAMRLRRARGRAPSTVLGGSGSEADRQRMDSLAAQLEALVGRMQAAESQGRLAIRKVGIVRYNPFEDTGSNQSFVLALLDTRGDGFVLSSLHSRQQTRVFLKQVTGRKAETALSQEESEAIRRAFET